MARGEVKTLYFADGTTVTPPENVPFINAELDGANVSNYLDFDHVATPLNPPASTLRIYAKSDNSLYAKTTAGVELPIGSGSGTGQVTFFYDDLSNGSASNWVSYDDGSAAVPVDGTGGTPSTLTVTASTSSPLRGTYSLQIAKSAADGRGEGIAAAFTIPNGYIQAAKRTISFLWDGSGANYVAGDMACYVYDVTNATLITPSVAALPAAKVPIQISWDSSSSSSYRLIFHVTTTNAASYTVKLDDITVGPGQIVNSAASGYLGALATTGSWLTNTTYTGRYWRNNELLIADIEIVLSGAPTAATLDVNILSGLTADLSRMSNPGSFGQVIVYDDAGGSGSSRIIGYVGYLSSTAMRCYALDDLAATDHYTREINATNPITFANLDRVLVRYSIPISQWANTPHYLMSDAVNYANTRFRTVSNSTATVANNAVMTLWTSTDYNVGAATFSSGVYTTPTAGYYRVSAALTGTGATAVSVNLQKNGTSFVVASGTTSAYASGIIYAAKGDSIQLLRGGGGTLTLGGSTVNNFLEIERLSDYSAGEAVAFGAATSTSSGLVSREASSGEGDIGTVTNWASPGSKKFRWNTVGGLTTLSWYITSNGGSVSTNTSVFYFPVPAGIPAPINFSNQVDTTGAMVAAGTSFISNNNSIASNTEFEQQTTLGYSSSILQVYIRCAASAKTIWTGSVTYRSQ